MPRPTWTSLTRKARQLTLDFEIRHQWPRLTRFYGLCPSVLVVMPRWLRAIYIDALPTLNAEEQLASFQVADFPNMEKDDRTELHRKLVRFADGDVVEDAEAVAVDPSSDHGRHTLAGMGIKVVQG